HAGRGRLAHVVGPRLERHAEHPDPPHARLADVLDDVEHMRVVAPQDLRQQRQARAALLRLAHHRPHVLRQTRTAERERRAESRPPCLPLSRSRIGRNTSSAIHGSVVLRTTTRCRSRFARSACPICSHTRDTNVTSGDPSAPLGVPTQMSEISVVPTARAASVVAVNCPVFACAASNSSSPASMMGLLPDASRSTFAAETSTPTTRCPRCAKHPADTAPTYPRPKMEMLGFCNS